MILPDLLAPNLRLVLIGTAPGTASARAGAYYAKPGNRFWPALYAAGITPTLFAPFDYPRLLALGVGLTDVCKTAFGVDSQIAPGDFDPAGLSSRLERYAPAAVAFTSKKGASLFLGRPTGAIPYGWQADVGQGTPPVFVLPSPSGLATRYWTPAPWMELGRWFAGG